MRVHPDLRELSEDRQGFRAWLIENLNKTVGRAGEPCLCPVANWAKSRGFKEIFVAPASMTFIRNSPMFQPPYDEAHWIQQVIEIVDSNFNSGSPVKGRQVLRLLGGLGWT